MRIYIFCEDQPLENIDLKKMLLLLPEPPPPEKLKIDIIMNIETILVDVDLMKMHQL